MIHYDRCTRYLIFWRLYYTIVTGNFGSIVDLSRKREALDLAIRKRRVGAYHQKCIQKATLYWERYCYKEWSII